MTAIVNTTFRCDEDFCSAEGDDWGMLEFTEGWTKDGRKHYCFTHSIGRIVANLPPAPYYIVYEVRNDGAWPQMYLTAEAVEYFPYWNFPFFFDVDARKKAKFRTNDCHWKNPSRPRGYVIVTSETSPWDDEEAGTLIKTTVEEIIASNRPTVVFISNQTHYERHNHQP